MQEARAQLALLRFARLIVSQLGSISSLRLIPTIHSFSSLRVQCNAHGALTNPDLSQATAPSKQKRTHAVFRVSSAHRLASTSKPRFVGERVQLGDIVCASSERNKGERCNAVYSVTNSQGFIPSEEFFSKEVYSKDLKTYRVVKRNMIAYNPSRINIGSVALQDKCNEVVVSPLYVVFSVDENRVMPDYVVRFLKSKPGLDQIAFQSIGTIRNNLKFKAMCQMELKLPSLNAQRGRLANLTSIEAQINQSRKTIEELDQLVKSRFVEMFLSSSWPVATIGECATDIHYGTSEKASTEGEYVYLRMNNIGDDGSLDLSDTKRITLEGKALSNCLIRKGDLLFNRTNSREKVGKTCVFCLEEPMVVAGYIIRVRLDDRVDSTYLAAYMNLSSTKALLRGMAKGAVHQANINAKQLASIEFPLADIEAQKEFVAFVRQVDKSRFVRDHEMNFRCERFTLSWSTIA